MSNLLLLALFCFVAIFCDILRHKVLKSVCRLAMKLSYKEKQKYLNILKAFLTIFFVTTPVSNDITTFDGYTDSFNKETRIKTNIKLKIIN